MYRVVSIILVVSFLAFCCSCKTSEPISGNPTELAGEGEVFEIIIPASFMKYSGMEKEEVCESISRLGSDFSTSICVLEDEVKLQATQKQIDGLIQNNNDNTKRYIQSFVEYDEKYRFVGSEDYSQIELYCDEQLDNMALFTVLAAASTTYAMNNILYNKTSDWDVVLKIINCHTDKVVVEGSVLTNTISISNEIWEASR